MVTASDERQVQLLHFGFNQDAGCFACGTSNGFRVYNCEPFTETSRREFSKGGVGNVEMLFRCNIWAIVGGGSSPRYPPNKVVEKHIPSSPSHHRSPQLMIWDDHQGRCIGELSFRSQVHAVRLRRDRIVVALEHKVLIYNFADLHLLQSIETLPNPLGLLALSSAPEQNVLATPGLHPGQVRIELHDVRRTRFVQAHASALACVALSGGGRVLATASEKGTLVRVWSTIDGSKLQELRRGADPACIFSLAFSKEASPSFLAVSSDKTTVHVFSLVGGEHAQRLGGVGEEVGTPPRAASGAGGGWRSYIESVLPSSIFSSERSFAQFRLPDEEGRTAIGFGQQPNTLLVIGSSGTFYVASFDMERGGPCEERHSCRFLELASDL